MVLSLSEEGPTIGEFRRIWEGVRGIGVQGDRPAWLQRSIASPPTGVCPPAGLWPSRDGDTSHGVPRGRRAQGRHTVAADEHGCQLAAKTVGAVNNDHLGLVRWADKYAGQDEGLWGVEACRHLSRRLEKGPTRHGRAHRAGASQAHGPCPWLGVPTASPTRSTRLPSLVPRCANQTCPLPASTARPRGPPARRSPGGLGG
jgi:hypothetical protein